MSSLRHKNVVIFLSKEAKTGGEKYLTKMYDYFKEQAVSVYPVYLDDRPRWPRPFGLPLDCFISNFYFFWTIKRYRKLTNIILFEDFHYHPRLLLCNVLMKILNKDIKLITLMQLSLFYHKILKNPLVKKMDQWAVRFFLNHADKILCNSHFTREEVISNGVSFKKVEVVYCGYDELVAQSENDKRRKDKMEILFVGQCATYKGLVYLLEAVSLLPDERFILNIVGNTQAEPAYFKRLTQLLGELALDKRVVFHGHLDAKKQLASFYERADIFVLPSLVEGFGIVLLEAMSFGLPIVATKAGAISELVKNEENGLLVPPSHPEALADALKCLLDSVELRQKLGTNGRNFYQSHREFYSWPKVGERIMKSFPA